MISDDSREGVAARYTHLDHKRMILDDRIRCELRDTLFGNRKVYVITQASPKGVYFGTYYYGTAAMVARFILEHHEKVQEERREFARNF